MATPFELASGTGNTTSMFYIGGLNVETGSLFVSDIIHHHCALGVIGLVATHFYNIVNWACLFNGGVYIFL